MRIGFIGLGMMGSHMVANLQKAGHDLVIVDVSTSSPTLIRRIYKVLGERGVIVADAPVSGGTIGAEEASLQIMVGSDPDVFEQIKPALLGIGDKITYIGEVGAGAVAKLVHNQIAFVVQAAVAEGLTLGTKAGIAPEKLLEAIRGGAQGPRPGHRSGQRIRRTHAAGRGRRAEPDRMPQSRLGWQRHDRRVGPPGGPRTHSGALNPGRYGAVAILALGFL